MEFSLNKLQKIECNNFESEDYITNRPVRAWVVNVLVRVIVWYLVKGDLVMQRIPVKPSLNFEICEVKFH